MAYIGPDQLMPLASFFGAIVGAILIFWRSLKGAVVRLIGKIRGEH
jgi:hypothetical protein